MENIIEENTKFDEKNTEEIAIKKKLNILLYNIITFDANEWEEIHNQLNEGIVGKNVSSKDCYRIGFIKYLIGFTYSLDLI